MSRAFSTGHHPLGTDLRIAAIADADDVAQLLSELGYPCDIDEAAERIAAITDNDRQALVVTPTAQGLGIGRALLKEAERRARVGGAARIELTSGAQRTEAHAFYRACGYKDSSVRFVKLLGA